MFLGSAVVVVVVECGRFVELEKLGEKGTRVWNWYGIGRVKRSFWDGTRVGAARKLIG